MTTTKRQTNPIQFFREVREEGEKVTWTTWKETLVTTIMVFIMVVLSGIYFFVVDGALSFIVRGALRLLNGAG